MGAAQQQSLFSGVEEAGLIHNSGRHGYFSLLTAGRGNEKVQESYRLADMAYVLEHLNPAIDSWMSQAEFGRANRRVVNLLRIGLVFADLDTYKMPWATGKSTQGLLQAILSMCEGEGVPKPSIVVYSGRGLQAKWLLDGSLPRDALPRWNAVQRHLTDKLADAGADPAARDASRVLRVVETRNSKSGEQVQVVHVTAGQDGLPIRYSFDYLAECLLPVARWDIEEARAARAEKTSPQLLLLDGFKKPTNLVASSGRQLAWRRLEDLRMLAQLRGGVQEGQRMLHMFWQLNFLLLSGATNSKQMWHEALELGRQIGGGSWYWEKGELSTLYRKSQMFAMGDKVRFAGREWPALYTPNSSTLIDLFGVTDTEMRQLRTIVSSAEAARRHCSRQEARRRAAGAVPRDEYLSGSLSASEPWKQLGMSRASWYRAGKPGLETSPCVLLGGVAQPVAGTSF